MIHPATAVRPIDEVTGLGVVATAAIPAGTVMWVLDDLDQRLSPARQIELAPVYGELLDRYSYTDRHGSRVLCWDHARYVNHSCAPTCMSPGVDGVEIAIRDIGPGEQITDDYGSLNLEQPMDCACGAPACRGRVQPSDFDWLARKWDRTLRRVLPSVRRVPQPLAFLAERSPNLRRLLDDPMSMPSISSLRCAPGASVPLSAPGPRDADADPGDRALTRSG